MKESQSQNPITRYTLSPLLLFPLFSSERMEEVHSHKTISGWWSYIEVSFQYWNWTPAVRGLYEYYTLFLCYITLDYHSRVMRHSSGCWICWLLFDRMNKSLQFQTMCSNVRTQSWRKLNRHHAEPTSMCFLLCLPKLSKFLLVPLKCVCFCF